MADMHHMPQTTPMMPMDHSNHSNMMPMKGGGMDHSNHTMPSGGNMDHMMMMKMYFHTGVMETILFEGWKTSSVGTLVASFIGIFIMAFLYEGLKFFRESLQRQYYTSVNFTTVAVTSASAGTAEGEMQKVVMNNIWSIPHLLQTYLHVIQLFISYMLMLIFMTFNVWLCLAVALGAGFGYFVFGWRRAIVVNVSEHCH